MYLRQVAHSIFHQGATSAAGSPSSAGSGMAVSEADAMSTSFGSELSISLAQPPALPELLPKLGSLQVSAARLSQHSRFWAACLAYPFLFTLMFSL
jgi:hypothetical protein